MFEFKVKGRTLEEAKKALQELSIALGENKTVVVKNTEVVVPVKEEEYTDEDLSAVHAPVASVDTGEVDSLGYPWDERIHASSRAKISDGTWRVKRGVSDQEVAKIQASTPRKTVVVQEVSPVEVAAVVTHHAPVTQPAVVQEAPKVAPSIPLMSSGHTLETFKANFPMVMGSLITEGKVTQAYVNELKAYFKVEQIWALNDEQKSEVFESFVQYGLIQKVG